MQWCPKAELQYLLGSSIRLFLHPEAVNNQER